MQKKIAVSALLATITWANAALSQPLPEVKVGAPPFKEHLDPSILTNAGDLLGVQMGDPLRRVSSSVMTVTSIRSTDNFICVSVEHVTGAYTSSFTVANPKLGGTVKFVLPAKKLQTLSARAGELSILARASQHPNCSLYDPILPAGWGNITNVKSAPLYALVNDGQAGAARSSFNDRPFVPCKSLYDILGKQVPLRSYQLQCPISLSQTCVRDGEILIQLMGLSRAGYYPARIRERC